MHSTDNRPWWQLLDRGQWFTFLAASLAWLFDSLDQQLFNLARDAAIEQLVGDASLALERAPYTTSFFLVGWAIGGLTLGALGDRLGRARMLTLCVLLYSVCTGLSAFSTGFWDFCTYRLVTGVGVGGVFGLAVALISDTAPDRARTPALALLQGLSLWGNIAAGLIGMGLGLLSAHGPLPFGLAAWQVMFLIGAVPAFLSLLLFARLREPESWLKAREEGLRRGVQFGSYRSLLSHPRWAKHAWLGLLLCSAGIIGLWGIGNFHPKIVRQIVAEDLAQLALSPEALASEKAFQASLALLLQNAGGFLGMMAMARVAHRYGRKPALALSLLLSFGTTVLVFTSLRHMHQIYWMIPLMGFGQLSVFCVYAIYLPELFPGSLRSTGTSFCYNFGRMIAATAPFTLGMVTRHLGGDMEGFRRAGLWVSVVLLAGLLALPRLPETRDTGLPKEE